MTRRWSNVTRGVSMIVILVGCATAVPADAQTVSIPPRSTVAYTVDLLDWWCPPCMENTACDGGCYLVYTGTAVLTPFAATAGPADAEPTWSPGATHIAYVSGTDIVVVDATGGPSVNITNTTSREWSPAWSPDGRRLAFASDRDGQPHVYVMNLDGSNVVRLAPQVGYSPTWSPDSSRIAFACVVETSNTDICAINSDGTGFARLTDHPAWDDDPAWSPDGAKIAFASNRYGTQFLPQLAVMNADGSGVSSLGGVQGRGPAWSSDGRRIAFTDVYRDMYVMKADGSEITLLAREADSPAWMPGSVLARFSTECSGLVCRFDASSSVGSVMDYRWDFGDTATASGQVVSHTFADGGTYTISLAVTNANRVTATDDLTLTLNRPPVASFTASCDGIECIFDASASSDSDGRVVDYNWNFGDGSGALSGGATITHTYRAAGTFAVILRRPRKNRR
jgi:dipeptidyl aminopeptidase/acylaminoacyl peptidase